MAADSTHIIINCVIADDEPVARSGMLQLVRQVPYFNCVGIARDALEVNNFLLTEKVDLLFLDIQMPKITGLDYIKTLKKPPKIIFTTAYSEYALESYELDVIDYLLKPITLQRFLKAAAKTKEYFELLTGSIDAGKKPAQPYLFVKVNKQLQKLLFDEILFIEAMLNYVIIYTVDRKIITYSSMKTIMDSLPSEAFLKIHKSYIIAITKINGLEGNEVSIGLHKLPVSRSHKDELLKIMSENKL